MKKKKFNKFLVFFILLTFLLQDIGGIWADEQCLQPRSICQEQDQRVAFLREIKTKIENGNLPDIIMFGDKHGDNADLERILKAAREAAASGRRLSIIGHGDYFDRGERNRRVWEILRELKEIADSFPHISTTLLLGNHDVLLIRTVLLNDVEARKSWYREPNGGDKTVLEFTSQELMELAGWLLKNLQLFYVDELGFLHVHAGIPANTAAEPLITRATLEKWQGVLADIQSGHVEEGRLGNFFRITRPLYWIQQQEWINQLADIDVAISPLEKTNLFQHLRYIVEGILVAKGKRLTEVDIDREIRENWQEYLIDYESLCSQFGVIFRLRRNLDQDKLDRFLRELGVLGVVFGHIHYQELLNYRDRLFCIDVEDGDAGHLEFNKDGLWFNSLYRPTRTYEDLVVSAEDMLTGIQAEIDRCREKLRQRLVKAETVVVDEAI